jgi:CDGSH iron-sulfur domain-containing protein 3
MNSTEDGRAMADVTIKVRTNGPYQVSGEVTIVDMAGNKIAPDGDGDVFLCRCGQSGEKPFCDGSHKRLAWKDGSEG